MASTFSSESMKEKVWIKSKPKLSYDLEKVVLNHNSKRTIFRGYYEDKFSVAIQEVRIEEGTLKEINREFQILRQLENHENFIRYFCYEEDAEDASVPKIYIAIELCTCSVGDLYEPKTDNLRAKSQEIRKTLRPKTILFQATRGLEYLHSNGYVHRNVKPSSFLIKEVISRGCTQFVIKIADFRLSRKVEDGAELSGSVASDAWEAPESREPRKPVKPSLDVFILGCFFHFVIVAEPVKESTDGVKITFHPFGNKYRNVINQNYQVYQPEWKPAITDVAAIALVKSMLQFDESKRPSLYQVLENPFFRNPSSNEYYPMYSYKKPGKCVIFNQELFKKLNGTLKERHGSRKDSERLEKTFKDLGYEVEVFKNTTSIELKTEIMKLSRKDDLTDYGSLVVCLLSHGFEGHILCSDNVPVNINSLRTEFSLNICPSLYGKPKIFIVQACRETLRPETTLLHAEQQTGGMNNWTHSREGSVPRNDLNLHKITEGPPLLDFLTVYSTLEEEKAVRDEGKGSWFIQSLCDALNKEYLLNDDEQKRDLESVLRGPGGVQEGINTFAREAQTMGWEDWQTMGWEACLTQRIQFKKGM